MIALLQNIHKLSCRRRASTVHAPASPLGDVASRFCTKSLPGFYDDACKSTDPSTIADSFDGSDTDNSDIMPKSDASTGYSESSDQENCITDSSSGAAMENLTFRHGQGFQRRHTNAEAAVSVPASQNRVQHLRESIRSVINALDEWEASTAAEDHCPNGDVQSHTLAILEQALSKLSPQDAAMVRTFVDAKLTPQVERSHCHSQSAEPSPQVPALLPQIPSPASVPPESSNYKQPAAIMCKQSAAMGCSGVKQRQLARARNMQHSTATRQDCDSELGAKLVERSLRANLRELTQFDPAQVLMLRRVSYLGLNSQAQLEAYFSQFGIVERIMVCRSRSKSVPGHTTARMRMTGRQMDDLGFLVMRQTKDVDGILAYGPEHVVQGTIVTVGPHGCHELKTHEWVDPVVDSIGPFTFVSQHTLHLSTWDTRIC